MRAKSKSKSDHGQVAAVTADDKFRALSRGRAVLELSMDGRFVEANAEFLAMTGYSRHEIIGEPHSLVWPEHGDTEFNALWAALRSGKDVTGEYSRIGRDGRNFWIRVTYNVILGPDGAPTMVLGQAVEITNEKLAHADHSGQIAAIGKSQAVVEFDLEGGVLAVNDRFLDIFGYARQEVVGRHHGMFVDRETRASAEYAAFWAALRAGEFMAGEFKRLGRGDHEVWIQATYNPIFDLDGRPFKVVKYAADVTDAKLKGADVQGQIAAIHKSTAVVEFDLDGTVLSANQNFLDVTGYGLSEIVGRHHRIFMPPEEVRRQAYEDFWSLLREGQFHTARYRRLTRDGGEIWLQASYNPIHDLNGRPYKIVKYAIDVTEAVLSKQSEVRLQAAAAAAEASAKAKGDFLANMSHELRTPLTSILGFAKLIGDDAKLPARHRAPIETIGRAGEALLTVVNDILDFSKLEAGALTLAPAPMLVSEFVRGLDTLVRGQAEEKDLTLTCSVRRDGWVMGDAARLRQVVLNLLSNAIKFTASGTVRVTLDVEPAGRDRIVLSGEVVDTGLGLEDDDILAIFDRFTQVDSSATRRHGGAGLGLAIVRQLVDQMGGEIGARSDGRTGSTFWFRIPLPSAEAAKPASGIDDAAEDIDLEEAAAPVRLLIVDDHPSNRALLAAMLENLPVHLTLVENGAEALEAVRQGPFDLVFMDLHMPVMDGLAATRAIRALPGSRGATPIVALTASVLPEQVATCLEAGMDGHLGKPIDFEALVGAINAHARAEQPEEG